MPVTILSACPVLEQMIATNRTIDCDGDLIIPKGLSTLNNLIVLDALCRELEPAWTLEIGLAYAASALVFTQSHKNCGALPCKQHIAVDPFQNQLNYAGITAIKRAGLTAYLQHIVAYSDNALPRLLEEDERFGIIYIDGSHLFEDVFIDCHYATQLLHENGIMLLDDSTDPHVAKVIRFLRGNMRHALCEVDLSAYRADRGASLRYKIAKAMGRIQLTAFRKIGSERRPYDAKLAPF